MPDSTLFTYQDALDAAADYLDGASSGADVRQARRAVNDALRDLANENDWSCYKVRGRLSTVASYATGTITYTNSTRIVTLASGTWPTWAAYGVLKIGDVRYTVASRTSDTVIVLSSSSNPGADVAAGTSYTIYRDQYAVPSDFGKITTNLFDAASRREIEYLHARDALRHTRWVGTTSEPMGFTIVGASDTEVGRPQPALVFEITPAPSTARTLDYLYVRKPRPLRIENETTGTVSVTADSAVVTGSGTAFKDAHVGSVFRIANSTTDAPSLYGAEPIDQERTIISRASDTSVTVDSVFTTSRTSVKYVISDPVDLDAPVMLNAYTAGLRAKLAHLRSKDDRAAAEAMYLEELRRAAAADSRNGAPRGSGGQYAVPWATLKQEFGTIG